MTTTSAAKGCAHCGQPCTGTGRYVWDNGKTYHGACYDDAVAARADLGQAQEAWEAQKAAEAEVQALRREIKVANYCNNALGRLNDVVRKRAEAAEAQAAAARGDWRRVVAAITGNPSATRCDACRVVGMTHCADAFYGCSGMRDYTVDEVLAALSAVKREAGE